LVPDGVGGWKESVIYSFTGGTDGGVPFSGLIFDKVGNLYGTTFQGSINWGTVFELTRNGDGSWSESTLYIFKGGSDGGNSVAGLTFDPAGNLYGTTRDWGRYGYGNVFELVNANGKWSEKVLHQFTGYGDGGGPVAGLTFDNAGNLYGTPLHGNSAGVVFKLAPILNGGWHETVLHRFTGAPSANPAAGVIFDALGNIYGTTSGGAAGKSGTVFEITAQSK
jgi:hypothetical protein